MTLQQIFDLAWVPILTFGVTLGLGLNMLITKSPQVLKGKKDKTLYKDPEAYAIHGGRLMLLLALGALIMAVLLFINAIAALAAAVVTIAVYTVLWKRMHTKYGPY